MKTFKEITPYTPKESWAFSNIGPDYIVFGSLVYSFFVPVTRWLKFKLWVKSVIENTTYEYEFMQFYYYKERIFVGYLNKLKNGK